MKNMSTEGPGKTKVFVGVSGGVDSSVAAGLLKEQGYDVTGVFIKIWHKELSQCDWRREMQDAMRVCAHLEIPFQMIDLSDTYFKEVISYLINEYKIGRTPNPDVMCNSSIKFGAFYAWAMEQGADYVATGHYARVQPDGTLCRAIDPAKDQSYFLWNVPKDRLARTLFPVGNYQKAEVRKLAERFGLPTAMKPDSQGLCFIGDVDLKSFLEKHLQTVPGNVLNTSGEVIGTHKGAVLYTNGERHGFTIQTNNTEMLPHYVVARDIEKNTITVSPNPQVDDQCAHIVLAQTNFFTDNIPTTVEAVLRYHSDTISASCTQTKSGCELELSTPVSGVTVGQSAVLYVGDVCVGGGIIDQA
jgi:tRNA-specific 2-thiouridylase